MSHDLFSCSQIVNNIVVDLYNSLHTCTMFKISYLMPTCKITSISIYITTYFVHLYFSSNLENNELHYLYSLKTLKMTQQEMRTIKTNITKYYGTTMNIKASKPS